ALGTNRWDAKLHAPRTGDRQEKSRAGRGHLQPGRDSVRLVDGPTALPGRNAVGHRLAGARKGSRAAARGQSKRGPRPGNDLLEVSGEGTGEALRFRGGPGRRSGALVTQRADSSSFGWRG